MFFFQILHIYYKFNKEIADTLELKFICLHTTKCIHTTLHSHAICMIMQRMHVRAVFDLLSTKPLYSAQRVFIDALLTLS